ncbi:hypothetical protein Bca4012_062633 [Brassica carinata]|uniref:anthranilate synthase n=1 Tax=Brassica carinata TaxID=52824 RepID=A0A8X7U8V1_BRACI|nr:hypothetical protein Bca52824_064164 [Brassica carinata]
MAATTTTTLYKSSSCLLQPKSGSTTRLNPSSLVNPCPNPTRVSVLGKSRRHVVTKASIEMSQSNSSPSSVVVVNSSSSKQEQKGPIIVIDNYDSFTYNLCQYMGELGCHFEVYRNDELTVEELKSKNPRGVLISPGPGTPQDSGISLQTVLELGPHVPLFGVCMGLQCIGEAFGGKIVRSPFGVMHGKSSLVHYDEKGEDGLFSGLSNPFLVGRYHSLVIEKDTFPSDELEVTAWTEDGLVMAARHRKHKHIQGVQFHPESIITTEGKTIVRNFIRLLEKKRG